jgi:hypothetical protein
MTAPMTLWRCFEAVWPDKIHQVYHRVFTPHTRDIKSDVLHDDAGSLTMDKITVCESIFEHGNHGVAVVRQLGADVFEDEGEGLQTTGADVKLHCPVFVKNSRDTREGPQVSATMAMATVLQTRL